VTRPDSTVVVSVALCTFRGELYLAVQVDSILAQTRPPQELVVFDDASPDGTWALLESFAPRIRAAGIRLVMHRNAVNVGYIANFEQALRATTGDVVFLCDQDDIWHPTKIERFAAEFERRPDLLMLHSDARLVDSRGQSMDCTLFEAFEVTREELAAVHAGDMFKVLLRRNIVTGATMAVRRAVFAGDFSVPEGWIHDEWLAMVATSKGRVDCLEVPSIDYRQHGNNQIGARRRGFVERLTGGGMSRLEFMTRTLLRTQTLLDLAEAGRLELGDSEMRRLRDRLTHARFRAMLPHRIYERFPAILREHASGRYSLFSNGPRSAVSDLLLLRR
jgi:glycosyltransferase involved in cell wall biosynthesis